MTATLPILVFTDLDGTLIDHDTYRWEAAKPALDALRRIGAGVVLASSKTAPEISALRVDLQLEDWPAIVENGSGVLPPQTRVVSDGGRYDELRAVLDALPADLRSLYQGFGDLGPKQVAQITGLSPQSAVLACERAFSEPGLWHGDDAQKQDFIAALAEHGVIAQQGGRFLTLSFGGNKADQMRAITQRYAPEMTVALGDAPNDIAMLETADLGIVVANPHSARLPELAGENLGRIMRSTLIGPRGWNDSILTLLRT